MDPELGQALAAVPNGKMCEVAVREHDAITRTGDFYKAVWDVPYGKDTEAALDVESMCRSVLTHCGFKMKKRRIHHGQNQQ